MIRIADPCRHKSAPSGARAKHGLTRYYKIINLIFKKDFGEIGEYL